MFTKLAIHVKLFFVSVFTLVFQGTATAKLKGLIALAALSAPVGFIEPIKQWFVQNNGYIQFVLAAIILDHLFGTIVHAWWKRDFSIKENALGLVMKLFVVFAVGILFEGINYIYAKQNILSEYLAIITRLVVFLYPALGACKNCAIMTNGKFPPLAWIRKMTRFNHNLDMREFQKNTEDKNINHQYED